MNFGVKIRHNFNFVEHVAVTSPVTCAVACLLPLFWQRRPQVVACNLRLGIQSPEAK